MASSAFAAQDLISEQDLPLGPTRAAWQAMSLRERDQLQLDVIAALQARVDLMGEGLPHSNAHIGTTMALWDYFGRAGRDMFVAPELAVLYPNKPAFSPDLIAVAGVRHLRHEDTRLAWVVAHEGRGVDLALEILFRGDRSKDLVSNVARYARLGIPEYFVYDRMHQRLYGFRLAGPESSAYVRIPSSGGRLSSRVLGLDLGIIKDRLRFFEGEALIPEPRELIARLEVLLTESEQRFDQELTARLESERLTEEALARVQEEARLRVEEAEARAAAEARLRAELEQKLAALLAERSQG